VSLKYNDGRGKWEVRWLEGGHHRSRLFERKGDAEAFDLDVRRRKQLGGLAPEVIRSRKTLAEFVRDEWWPRYAVPDLSADTRRRYLEIWGSHILDRLGGYELREFTPQLIADFRHQLERRKAGVETTRKALWMLSSMFRRAQMLGLVTRNPVDAVDKPRQRSARMFEPLSPLTVERIRAIMLAPQTRTVLASRPGQRKRRAYQASFGSELDHRRNALIVSMIAYAGLRPAEDRSARWAELHGRKLHVFASKTETERRVTLLVPLFEELTEWRWLSRPTPDALIAPRPSGGEWTRSDWGNWRRRVWRPAAMAAGVTGDLRPYRLRGSFASLLLWEGRSLTYVAEQDGHSVATLARHYAGVIDELEDQPRVPAAQAILDARAKVAELGYDKVATGS
jgi:integrase